MKLRRTSLVGFLLLTILAAGCGEGGTDPIDDRHVFRYVPPAGAPQINSISVAGSFNDWNTEARPMTRQADGTWEARVQLSPGSYQYKYVFNGDQWAQNMCNDPTWGNPAFGGKVDPSVTNCTDDGFGGQNAVLVIP